MSSARESTLLQHSWSCLRYHFQDEKNFHIILFPHNLRTLKNLHRRGLLPRHPEAQAYFGRKGQRGLKCPLRNLQDPCVQRDDLLGSSLYSLIILSRQDYA